MKLNKKEWKRIILKGFEDGMKKSVELAIVAYVMGVAMEFILVTIPAFTFGAIVASFARTRFFG